MILNKIIFTLITAAGISFTACDNDNNNPDNKPSGHQHPAAQPHDQNIMMTIMHNSMNMDSMKHSGDPDHDFAIMMKDHHMGAIKMAEEELKTGDDAKMREMATMMKEMQEKEILELDSFLKAHQPTGMNMDFTSEAKAAMHKMETDADKQLLTGDTDHDFASLMIPHHVSATDMATSYLKYGKDGKLRAMAEKMVSDQKKEITELQTWLKYN